MERNYSLIFQRRNKNWSLVFAIEQLIFFFFIKVIINMYKESQHMKFLLQKREATSSHKQEPSRTPVSSEQMLCSGFGEGGNLHSDSARVYIQIVLNQECARTVYSLHSPLPFH